jgi:DNA repair protein RadD
MYGRFIEANAAKRDARIVGFTATPYRLDSGRLDRGEGAIFEKIVYGYGIARGIEDGYLSPLISPRDLAGQIDVSGVHTRGGEYVTGELERAATAGDVIGRACDEMLARGHDRRTWLVFCCGVKHAHLVKDALEARGLSGGVVTGETPSGERRTLIEALKAGRIRFLTSVAVLTTGTNIPGADMIALMRPTLSTGLYIQMAGRGTRLADPRIGELETAEERLAAIASSSKPNCLVLDFAGVIAKHGPVDAIIEKEEKKKREPDEAPAVVTKLCPGCGSLVYARLRTCPKCAFEFSFNEDGTPAHDGRADMDARILRGKAEPDAPQWRDVTGWDFRRHQKPGGFPSLRIDYHCGLSVVSEWLCFEHDKRRPREEAEKVWRELYAFPGHKPITLPNTVTGALSYSYLLRPPSRIRVAREGEYWRVKERQF